MARVTGTVVYVPTNSKTPGHYKARLSLTGGDRIWFHFDPSSDTPANKAKYREQARRLALDAKAKGLARPERGKAAPPGETLADYAERWVKDRIKRGLAKPANDRSRLKQHILPVIGTRPIAHVDADDVRAVVEALDAKVRADRCSWQTANKAWATLSKLLGDACHSKTASLRVRKDNPAAGVAKPDRGGKKTKQWLFPRELTKLLSCHAVPLHWRELYTITAYLYLRPGEAFALEWPSINMDENYVQISASLDLISGETKTTKTKAGRRVPIHPSLRPLLMRMGEAAKWEGRIIRGADLPAQSKLNGIPEKLSTPLRDHLRLAQVTRADLHADTATSKNVTFYDLRGTGITYEALAGTEALKIMQRAGHTTFATTLGYIREAEAVGMDVGTPFPPLPRELGGPDPGPPDGDPEPPEGGGEEHVRVRETQEALQRALMSTGDEPFRPSLSENLSDSGNCPAEPETGNAATPEDCGVFSWLRGLDLNQRPSGYEKHSEHLDSHELQSSRARRAPDRASSSRIVLRGTDEKGEHAALLMAVHSCSPDARPDTPLPAPRGALWRALGDALEAGDTHEAKTLYGLLERRARGGSR